MRRLPLLIVPILVATTTAQDRGALDFAQGRPLDQPKGAEQIIGTFSIVARDPATNELGVAVQSRAFAAGSRVPHAKAGVGAIATQASTNYAYGADGLALLEKGLSPEEVVTRLTEADPGRQSRQLAVMDATGRVKAYTGARTNAWAGHIEGKDYSVQGNILAGEGVVKAMAHAFETTKGELAERLMSALDAGQAAGGDMRGMQAGAILVVKPIDDPSRTSDRWVDIRVDDSPNPFTELRRLLNIVLAGRQSQLSGRLSQQGQHGQAIEAQKKAISMNPGDDQLLYGLAQRYAQAGDPANAAAALQQAIAKNARWRGLAQNNQAFDKVRSDPTFQKVLR